MVTDPSQTNLIQRYTDLRYLLRDKSIRDRFQLHALGGELIGKEARNITRVFDLCEAIGLSEDRVRLLLHRLREDPRTPEQVMERCRTVLEWSDGRRNRLTAPSQSPRSRAQNRQIHRDSSNQNRQIHRDSSNQNRQICRDSTHPSFILEYRDQEFSTHESESAPVGRESTYQQQVTNRGGQAHTPADIVSRVWDKCGLPQVDPAYRAMFNKHLGKASVTHIEVAARYFAADTTAVEKARSREALFLYSWQKYVAAWQTGEKEGVRTMPYPAKKTAPPVNDWQRKRDQGPTSVAPSRMAAPAPAPAPAPASVAPSRIAAYKAWQRAVQERVERIVPDRPEKAQNIPLVQLKPGSDLESDLHTYAQQAWHYLTRELGVYVDTGVLDVIEMLEASKVGNEDGQD